MSLVFYRQLTLFCILGLCVIFISYGITRLPAQKTLTLLLTALPLTFPIRGTFAGQIYTMKYSSLLSTWYVCLSGWLYIVHTDWARYLMLVAVILSLTWFFACLITIQKHKKS